jgi:hypothetical protein
MRPDVTKNGSDQALCTITIHGSFCRLAPSYETESGRRSRSWPRSQHKLATARAHTVTENSLILHSACQLVRMQKLTYIKVTLIISNLQYIWRVAKHSARRGLSRDVHELRHGRHSSSFWHESHASEHVGSWKADRFVSSGDSGSRFDQAHPDQPCRHSPWWLKENLLLHLSTTPRVKPCFPARPLNY